MAKARAIANLNAQASTSEEARVVARTRLDEMYSWEQYVDAPYHVQELHNLRIAAKRVRYTLEIFEKVLPEACRTSVKEIEQIQEELGTLHDSDIMIALLRLYLGSRDGGTGYEHALAMSLQQRKGKFALNPEMMASVVAPDVALSPEQRRGLEQLLLRLQRQREEQYTAFRQHWFHLEARDFRREMLSILEAEF